MAGSKVDEHRASDSQATGRTKDPTEPGSSRNAMSLRARDPLDMYLKLIGATLAMFGAVLGLLGYLNARAARNELAAQHIEREYRACADADLKLARARDELAGTRSPLFARVFHSFTSDPGAIQHAADLIQEAESECPGATSVLLWSKGQLYRVRGQNADALDAFAQAIALDSSNWQIQASLANTLFATGDLDRALIVISEAISLRPAEALLYHAKGLIFQESGRLEEAVTAYAEAIARQPRYAPSYLNQANALALLHRNEEAAEAYRNALDIDPKDALARYNFGVYLQGIGDITSARSNLEIAEALDPTSPLPYNNLGLLCLATDTEKAMAYFDKALALDPTLATALGNRGGLLRDQHKPDAALLDLQRAIELDPTCAFCFYNLGQVLRDLQRLDEALEAYDEALRLEPRYVNALVQRAVTWLKKQDYPRAEADLQEALHIDASCAIAHFNLSVVLRAQGRDEEAVAAASNALRCDSRYLAAYSQRGLLNRVMGNAELAVQDLKTCIALGSQSAFDQYQLSLALRAVGNTTEADQYLEAALRIDPYIADGD